MKHQGFSLLELLVSVSIVAVLGTLIAQVFFTTLRTNTKTEVMKEVKQNGDTAMETMRRLIQSARSVSTPCAESGTTSSSISLLDENGNSLSFGCVLDGAAARIASTSALGTEYLTNQTVTLGASCVVSSLTFLCTSSAGVPPSITISFQLSQSSAAVEQFEQSALSFQSSVSLRNPSQ